MNKKEFLQQLRKSLRGYDSYEVEGIIRYYDELVSDNMDAGLSEHQAVAALGNVNDIAACIKAEHIETRMKEPKPQKPVSSFFSLVTLCTSPLLFIFGFVFTLTYLILFITFFAVGVGIFVGGIGTIIMTVVNSIYAYGELGLAGILISAGVGFAAASILCLLGIMFYRFAILLIKNFTKTFARIIRKSKSKRRQLNESAC